MSKKLACFLILLATACGKAGAPHPPVPEIPAPVSDLVVSQRGGAVTLRWSYPALATSGKSLAGLRKVVVYRYSEPLPESLAASLSGPEAKTAHELFARIELPVPIQYRKLSEPVAELGADQLPQFSQGTQIVFEDAPPLLATSGRPVRYTYAVVTEGLETASELSNLVAAVAIDVAAAPGSLIARLTPEAVVLGWERPAQTRSGAANPMIEGYTIYRTSSEGLGESVGSTAADVTTYSDKPLYGSYTYRVAAIATNKPSLAESEPSLPASVEFRDMLPPPVPVHFAALVEESSVRLIWDPVAAADIAGYIVYRTTGDTRQRLNPALLSEATYTDATPQTGVGYVYSVTSIDKSGNESVAANAPEVMITK